MEQLKDEVRKELTGNILPFWMDRMADPSGGFYGRMDGEGKLRQDAEKGAILNARILWTFSSAWRILGDEKYGKIAERAFEYIISHFVDNKYGGTYWSLNADGTPGDTKKQFYAIAFMIYALAEYFRAGGCRAALDTAASLYRCIEEHSLDKIRGGYIEACTRNWEPIEDMRLSEKDRNDAKTMNTHLHILEAYTGLYRVWKDKALEASLKHIIELFLERITDSDGHLILFFNEDWHRTSDCVSYGHDIEASWLLCEAVAVLGDGEIEKRVLETSRRMADAAMEGFGMETGMEYEYDRLEGRRNASRDWWVQAETVVGCATRYRLTGDALWKERALKEWEFIKKHIICPDGEWYWAALPHGDCFRPDTANDRAGFWKCPYHNGRMCMELLEY